MHTDQQRPGCFLIGIGALSFVPGIGLVFGLVSLIAGALTWRRGGKLVAALGAAGILLSLALYGTLFYFSFVQRGGVYDGLRVQLTQRLLNELVPQIELYKTIHGEYPNSLEQVVKSAPEGSTIFINDPTVTGLKVQARAFYYERVDCDHYYLRSTGMDGIAFTPDDIIPNAAPGTAGKLGLLRQKQPGAASLCR